MPNRIDFQDSRFARPIRQLDRVLINKIAAGEVIERPASVVKELVENAFDAGATSINIVAKKSGTTFIGVTDDGCGIPAEQIKLAFSRHATSKIEHLDDLFSVWSYGFRGEALPSIASVSHLTLTTRHFAESEARCIVIEGGAEVDFHPVSAPVGTRVEVSHLFYNTPARRKFLKSEVTESRQIIRVAERMALGKPSVAMRLDLNERRIFDLQPDQKISDRMAILFGIEPKSIVEYDVELSGVSYLVYLAHPDQARNDRTRICLFVNGRSVASSTLIHAVTAGYGEFLPAGRYPLAAVFITVDPSRLDVNVHPTKAEVRLSEERAIHDNVYRIVKKALRDWRVVPAVAQAPTVHNQPFPSSAPRDPVPHRPSIPLARTERPPLRPGPAVPRKEFIPPDITAGVYESAAWDNTRPVKEEPAQAELSVDTLDISEVTYLGKAGSIYLLFLIRGELYIVDQHAAHERVLYEQALEQVEKGSATMQRLLFPETVELSAEEFLTFEHSQDILTKLGFDVGAFGRNAVVINGMPPVFRDKNPARIFRELLDDMAQLDKAGGDLIKSTAQSLACRAAVMAGDRLSGDEVRSLVVQMFATNNPYCCPHGRPTFIKVSREELDGRVGRT
jgi:DNA mismatch repair protein MutL